MKRRAHLSRDSKQLKKVRKRRKKWQLKMLLKN
jgi:hypothetical protein